MANRAGASLRPLEAVARTSGLATFLPDDRECALIRFDATTAVGLRLRARFEPASRAEVTLILRFRPVRAETSVGFASPLKAVARGGLATFLPDDRVRAHSGSTPTTAVGLAVACGFEPASRAEVTLILRFRPVRAETSVGFASPGIAGRHGERSAERPQLIGERGDRGDELAPAVRSGAVEQATVEHIDGEHLGVVAGGGRPCEVVVE